VDWLREHPDEADIVLMDVQMPVMNGYEATRQLRRVPALAELPVIALTAGAFMEQQELANEAGMNSFIAKPFDVDAAIALIIKVAGRAGRLPRQAGSVADPVIAAADQDLPGLAVAEGLKLWRRPAAYRQFLRRFAGDYADSAQLIARADKAEAAALAHKLKGAAAALAIDAVAALAGEIDDALRTGQDPASSLASLQAALDTALASIARYAPPATPAEEVRSETGGAV
jgi:CheY-like chemotaxis protein